MKMILILLTMSVTLSALAAPESSESSSQLRPNGAVERAINSSGEEPTCVFESADVGKMKFRGSSREEAFERTSRACLQARVQGYIKVRGDIPSIERKILFAEDCVNKTYCKH